MLELNDVQEGVLNIAFRVASEEKLPLKVASTRARCASRYAFPRSNWLSSK